jgi:hypothetical protein
MRRLPKKRIEGSPDMEHGSTSYAERANLTMRMHNRRFTRLTNAFSKKFENHTHMVAIYAVWYNWIRIHKSLRVTRAMAAGLSKTVMSWEYFVAMMDADQPDKKRGPYKKAGSYVTDRGPVLTTSRERSDAPRHAMCVGLGVRFSYRRIRPYIFPSTVTLVIQSAIFRGQITMPAV